MKNLQVEDTLHTHFEALAQQGEAKAALIATTPGLSAEVQELLHLAQLLWTQLRPVRPAAAFRYGLGAQLVTEARRRRTQEHLGISRLRKAGRPVWLLPVAALGTASLVGMGAYAYWRRFRQPADEQALAA